MVPAAILGFLGWLVYVNRGNSDVVTTFVSSAILGLIACGIAVWSHLKEKSDSDVVFTTTSISKKDMTETLSDGLRYLGYEHRRDFGKIGFSLPPGISLKDYSAFKPEYFSMDPKNVFDKSTQVYSEAIVFSIFQNFFQYFFYSWDISLENQGSNNGATTVWNTRKPISRDEKVSWSTISEKSKKDIFKVPAYAKLHEANFNKMSVPAGTFVKLYDKENSSVIEMRNQFCTLEIEVSTGLSMVGVGEIQRWVSVNENDWATLNYRIETRISYNRLRSGALEMPNIENWYKNIVTMIRNQFEIDFEFSKARQEHLISLLESISKTIQDTPQKK
jgi:hypothetical protein